MWHVEGIVAIHLPRYQALSVLGLGDLVAMWQFLLRIYYLINE